MPRSAPLRTGQSPGWKRFIQWQDLGLPLAWIVCQRLIPSCLAHTFGLERSDHISSRAIWRVSRQTCRCVRGRCIEYGTPREDDLREIAYKTTFHRESLVIIDPFFISLYFNILLSIREEKYCRLYTALPLWLVQRCTKRLGVGDCCLYQ